MAFRVSPGVNITEKDLTNIVPAVATTPGGFVGNFHWGPCEDIVTIPSENELARLYGKPTNENYMDFYSAANFLSYGNNCKVIRVAGTTSTNASSSILGVAGTTCKIKNETDFLGQSGTAVVNFAAKYIGTLGNSLRVAIVQGTGVLTGQTLSAATTMGAENISIMSTAGTRYKFGIGDEVTFNNSGRKCIIASITGACAAISDNFSSGATAGSTALTLNLKSVLTKDEANGATFTIKSVFASMVSTGATQTIFSQSAGGNNDLINVIVLDEDGKWSGVRGTVLEKFENLSRAQDARGFDGESIYYRNVINDQSKYLWVPLRDLNQTVDGGTAENATKNFATLNSLATASNTLVGNGVLTFPLSGGTLSTPTESELWSNGWSKFADAGEVDVSLLVTGNSTPGLCRLIVDNICESRKDCLAFMSPPSSIVNADSYQSLSKILDHRKTKLNVASSYAVMDSGWKYQLDTYNNIIRVMPLNPDIAGLVARTEFIAEAWFSPAGFNRGQIKNSIKLAYNPSSEAHRDELYINQINPVVSFPGQGTILYGDKTMQTKPSAFDRINVRRLFIVLEKAISTASKFFLFEQNDAFTRAQFKNMVVPFLRTIQQRRGITDFLVVCDDTNNPGEVVDRNEFVADIFIKPTRTINFIQLNFVATKTGVSFSEVAGA